MKLNKLKKEGVPITIIVILAIIWRKMIFLDWKIPVSLLLVGGFFWTLNITKEESRKITFIAVFAVVLTLIFFTLARPEM